MLNAVSGSFGYGRRAVAVGSYDPSSSGTTENLVAWFDPSYVNSSYITVLDTGATFSYATYLKSRAGTYDANTVTANSGGIYTTGINLLQSSESIPTNTTSFASSADAAAVPTIGSIYDGVVKADRVYPSSGSTGTKYLSITTDQLTSRGVTTSTPLTFSFYVKSLGDPFIKIGVTMVATISGVDYSCGVKFNLSTGLSEGSFTRPLGPGTVQTVDSATITPIGVDGWYRVSITKLYSSAVPGLHYSDIWIIKTSGGNDLTTFTPVAGDLSLGYYIWGRQLETGSEPGKYQRTISGYSYLTTPNSTPVLSWRPAGSTAGAVYQLSPGVPLSRNMSIFVFFRRRVSGINTILLENNTDADLRIIWNFSNAIIVGLNQSATPITFSASNTSTGYFIMSIVMNSSTVSLWLNGTQIGTSQVAPADPTGQTFNRLSGTIDDVLGDTMVYNKAMTIAERQTTEGYLAHKYAQQSLLPSDHPYKTTPPSG